MIIHDTEIVPALQAALAAKVGQGRYDLWFAGNARLPTPPIAHGLAPQSILSELAAHKIPSATGRRLSGNAGRALPLVFEVDATIGRSRRPARRRPTRQSR